MRNGAFTIGDFQERRPGDGSLIEIGRVPVFSFNQRCHPGAGLLAEYSEGEIKLGCHACGSELCRIAVAHE